ncbi:MAG: hypothetical protein HY880_05165 [Deltaproteobacteria bacterium]|nr:hypothetical protein [Deltaproteobacteria bacterium]
MATIVCMAFLTTSAAAEPLCKESLGEYYVNIGIANTGFGTGLDDAFEVVIRRMRPSSEQDLERLKAFNYFEGKDEKGEAYSDGRQYLWQKEGKQYRLFRKAGGRKDVRIDLFVVTFTPANKMKNMMRLMNANRTVYNELGLQSKLQVLGVMGVAFRGRHGKVEFINNLKADPGPGQTARAYVSNADTMLYRYAVAAGYDGADTTIDVSDWSGEPVVRTILRKAEEQYLLDNIQDFVQKQAYTKDLEDAISTFGDITVSGGIKPGDLKYIFMKCIPNGVGTYGSPRSAFIPLQVKDGNKLYYPVFVFPSAFSSTDALNAEIWKTALDIRWWNAAAYLDSGTPEKKRLREAVRRYDLPHLKLDSFKRADPFAWSDPKTAEYAVHFSLWALEKASLDAAANKPETPRAIAWTVSPDLVMAETAGSMVSRRAESAYNKFFTELVPDLGAYMKNKKAPSGKFAALKKAVGAVESLGAGLAAQITARGDDEVAAYLAAAIANGYVITKEEREKALETSLNAVDPYFAYLRSWEGLPRTFAEEDSKVLFTEIASKGLYAFDDLAWLNEMAQNYPLPLTTKTGGKRYLKDITAGKRMQYLVGTNTGEKKVKNLKNLDTALEDPQMISLHRDQAAIKAVVAKAAARGKVALDDLVKKIKEKVKVADYAKKKKELQNIKQELDTLPDALALAFTAKENAEKEAENALSPKEKARDDAFSAMSTACKGDKFSPAPWAAVQSLYNDIADAYSSDMAKMVACIEKANTFIKAREIYLSTATEHQQKIAGKAKPVYELDDKADELFDKLTVMVLMKDDESIDSFYKKIKRGLKKALIAIKLKDPDEKVTTWRIFMRRAFEQYLTATGSDKDADAYDALDAHLKRVPGLEVEYGN